MSDDVKVLVKNFLRDLNDIDLNIDSKYVLKKKVKESFSKYLSSEISKEQFYWELGIE